MVLALKEFNSNYDKMDTSYMIGFLGYRSGISVP